MENKHLMVGILAAISVFAIAAAAQSPATPGKNRNAMDYGMMNGAMGGCNMGFAQPNGEVQSVSGEVTEIEWHEIAVLTGSGEAEIHMPPWFAGELGIEEGDSISAIGVYAWMHGDKELMPYEITVNGVTYGNAAEALPVWMQ